MKARITQLDLVLGKEQPVARSNSIKLSLTKKKGVMINEVQSRRVLGVSGRLGDNRYIVDHLRTKETIMTKEKAVRVSETKTTETFKVPAYSDSKLTGYCEVTVFKLSEAGLAAAKANLTLGHLANLNRQLFTDAKNNLRRGTSMIAALKQLTKTNPKVESLIKVILAKAQSGELDNAFLKSIGA